MSEFVDEGALEFIESGPRRISLRRIVNGADLPWIVFSNSLLTEKILWTPQVAALGHSYNIALYDQHGHGKTPCVQDHITMDELADDLLAVIAVTGDAPVTFIGVSMGVPTGLLAYAKAPQSFARMVLVNGQVASTPGGKAMWDDRIGAASADFDGFCDATMRRWLGPEAADGMAGRGLLQMMKATSFGGFASCASALGEFDASAGLAALRIPVLAVAGRNDVALAAHMEQAFAPRVGVTFRVIDNAGHLAQYEQPDAFNALMSDFLHL